MSQPFGSMALVDVNDGASIELVKGEAHIVQAKYVVIIFSIRFLCGAQHVEFPRPVTPQV
jgi:hypothetical protein